MSLSGVTALLGIVGFSYMILALQLNSSFPPFYEKGDREKEFKLAVPFLISMGPILIVIAFEPQLVFLLGVVGAWCGLHVRRTVKERTNGPLPWLLNPLTIGILNRWPMLLFDTWAVGFAVLTGLLMMLSWL